MEMYTNSPAAERVVRVPFSDPAALTNVDIFAYKDGEEVFEFPNVTPTADELTTTIPMFLNQFDGRVEVHWAITYTDPADGVSRTVNKMVPVDMVTPILSQAEILQVWDTASPAEVTRIEKAVRHIIQAFTGQEFGHFHGTHNAKSIGGSSLRLPRRLIAISSFDGGVANPAQFLITDEGYTLRYYPWGVPPVKADYYGLHYHTGGVIHNPNNVRWQNFDEGRTFAITGEWGWHAVPEAVKEAAKLLVNDYACADSQYRDRYLTSMTAADWRIQFNSGAFLRTGNVRADQLLSEYVTTRGWGVV